MLQEGNPIPTFALPSDRDGEVSSEGLLGTRYVLFVYPKDDTFG
jgi:peroxiredoxin